MKNTILAAALSAVVLSSMPALAQPASGAQANLEPPNVQEFDKRMAQAQENMKKMQEQMDKINQTQDPEARQKLLQEHWATMQNNMQLMHGMWGPGGGMGCCMGGPGMGPGMTMGPNGRLLLDAYARTTKAAPVHDGSIHADAADDDGPHDATPAVHVDEVSGVCCRQSAPRSNNDTFRERRPVAAQ